tara:strand:- start:2295 stop:3200 length:906 start_codon:yes stop_codon:yes gene_type:complete
MSQLSVDSITGRVSGSAPTFPNGAVVTGIVTATTFDGTATSATVATTLSSAANITTGTISNDRLPATITKNLTGNVTGNCSGTAGSTGVLSAGATGADLTLSGNLTVNGTTTTIDTTITDVDSLVVDGAGTFGGTVRVNHTGNAGSDQLVRLGNVNNSGTNSAHLFLANGYYVSPTAVDGTGAAAKILADGTIHDSIGPLRRLGVVAHSTNYTLVASDAGKLLRDSAGSGFTIPQNVFSAGDMISFFNVSTSNTQVLQGTGVTLYNSADGATGTRTMAAKGVCTIVCTASNEFVISGSQVS